MITRKSLIRINRRWIDSISCSVYDQVLSAIDRASSSKKLKRNRQMRPDKRRKAPT